MIRFEQFSFQYGDGQQGVFDVNLEIDKGECVLFCGPSGCGKSTLLKSVNGLIPHFIPGKMDGSVTVGQAVVAELPMYELARRVSSVFQNPKTQFFNTDAESEIVYALENQGLPVEEINNRLEKTVNALHLEALRGRSMFALSGGEKQRIAFAAAYIADTDIVVLDEPTANLDGESIETVREILRQMKEAGKTIIIAEHRLSWLNGLADTVYRLNDGRIVQRYKATEFFSMEEAERKALSLRRLREAKTTLQSFDSMPHAGEPILQTRDLTLAYKKKIIRRHLDFDVYAGDILGITGANGVGKSTLLRTLSGLAKAPKGAIWINRSPASEKTRRAECGMVMQDVTSQLFSDSCLSECLLGNPGLSEERAIVLLREMGLEAYADRHPQSLSGGQMQRLAMAAACAAGKEILLLDEPTSGLDYGSMLSVRQALKKLARQGVAIVLVTHDLELIETVCDRLIVLKKE